MTEPSTPLMRQYTAIKREHPTALLFFRLGDFYELFFDDAVLASKELQITLTSRNKEKGIAVPMCGVPYHAAEGYISKLIRKGFKVAICDQMESTKLAKKLVRREVTRVVTPGTAADSSLSSEENNFLAALAQKCCTAPQRRYSTNRDAATAALSPTMGLRVAPRRHSMTGSSRPITPFHSWKISLVCFLWRALAWQVSPPQHPLLAPSFITFAPRSAEVSITWIESASTNARTAWCWMP